MTYGLSNNCTKNYYNRTLTVQVIIEDVVTWIFLKHSVYPQMIPPFISAEVKAHFAKYL